MARELKRRIVAAFRPHNEGLAKLFGSLESDIMELIWQSPESSARDIFEGLRDQGQRISYGAVKTVLDRLVAKDVLARLMVGNQYVYRATLNREDFTTAAIREILDSLVSSFGAPVYAQFVEQVRSTDPDKLEQLNQLINDAELRLQDDASKDR